MTLQVNTHAGPIVCAFNIWLNMIDYLQVWDIGGQSISSKMLPSYIYGSQASIQEIILYHYVWNAY
jgi:hypothetical protein